MGPFVCFWGFMLWVVHCFGLSGIASFRVSGIIISSDESSITMALRFERSDLGIFSFFSSCRLVSMLVSEMWDISGEGGWEGEKVSQDPY